MKSFLWVISICVFQIGFTKSKQEYLSKNRYDLFSTDFIFPDNEFKIIGFGAWHGSSKTEDAEIILLKSLIKNSQIKYYIPETDFSIAHFFNEYLTTGDTVLLKDLVYHYGYIPASERSIQTYNKWKQIKQVNDGLKTKDKIQILGLDVIASYKYTVKHLLELIDKDHHAKITSLDLLISIVKVDTTGFISYPDSNLKNTLRNFIYEYENNKIRIDPLINNHFIFNHLLNSIKMSLDINSVGDFWSQNRDKVLFENYKNLYKYYDLNKKPQFCRFGVGHLFKERTYPNYATFFTQLIENNVYPKNKIISVIGYLKDSEILNTNHDKSGNYLSYNGVTDSLNWDGNFFHFKGIGNLITYKLSDLTLFKLNNSKSPFSNDNVDFIQLISPPNPPDPEDKNLTGKVTTNFLDYALLISNSATNIPIQEIK